MPLSDGKPCPRCGSLERYKNGKCAPCSREYTRRWRKENVEKARRATRRWRKENPEEAREASDRWKRNNVERQRRYRRRNRERLARNGRRWQRENPEKVAAKNNRRRARLARADGDYTAAEWRAVVRRQKGRCLACGKKTKLEPDHVVPLAAGGSNDISNIQGLCRSCNAAKGTKAIDYRKDGSIKRWIQKKLFGENEK